MENSRSDAARALEGNLGDSARAWWAWKTWGSWLPAASGSTADKREGSTLFFFLFDCKQWGDLNLAHDSHGNGFSNQPLWGINVSERGTEITHQTEHWSEVVLGTDSLLFFYTQKSKAVMKTKTLVRRMDAMKCWETYQIIQLIKFLNHCVNHELWIPFSFLVKLYCGYIFNISIYTFILLQLILTINLFLKIILLDVICCPDIAKQLLMMFYL